MNSRIADDIVCDSAIQRILRPLLIGIRSETVHPEHDRSRSIRLRDELRPPKSFQKNIARSNFFSYRTRVSYMRGLFFAALRSEEGRSDGDPSRLIEPRDDAYRVRVQPKT